MNKHLKMVVEAIDDKRGLQITALDMEGISPIADYFVICHGNSEKQVQAIAHELKKVVQKDGLDIKLLEGYDKARWVLLDIGDVVVHIFHKEERLYYNLEKLWGDASTVNLDEVVTQ